MPRYTSDVYPIHATPATIFNSGNLTGTPVQYPNATPGWLRRFVITNRHATNHVAIGLSATSGSPTFVASAAGTISATEGLTVFPASREILDISANMALWVAASAGSTPIQIQALDSLTMLATPVRGWFSSLNTILSAPSPDSQSVSSLEF